MVGTNPTIVIADEIRSVELAMVDGQAEFMKIQAGEPAHELQVIGSSRGTGKYLAIAGLLAAFAAPRPGVMRLLPDPSPAGPTKRQEDAQAALDKAQLKRDRKAAKRLKDAT